MRPSAVLLLGLLVLASCSKKGEESLDLDAGPPIGGAPAPPPPAEKKEEPRYFYPYAQKRDPFVPLVGGISRSASRASDMGSGELTNLELKGIMRDKRGKIALISSTAGEPYTLRAGRIYDRKNRIVSGVSGIIKENSVVLITQNRTIRELPLLRRESNFAVPSSQ